MIHPNIKYLFLYEYHNDMLFEDMLGKFLKSNLSSLIPKKERDEFESYVLDFSRNDPLGFRYIEKAKKPYMYGKNELLGLLKRFLKQEHFKNLTKKKRGKWKKFRASGGTRKKK